jgi:hypothetical protein
MEQKVPEALIAQIPTAQKNKACICKACIDKYYAEQAKSLSSPTTL